MNRVQKQLLDNLWYLNIVLKARQLGISTLVAITFLDDVLFNGVDAGIIAHTLPDAQRIFDSKVKFAWDNFPESLKVTYEVNTENTRMLQFKQPNMTSSIYVGASLRSGTVQRLHISELGTTDQKFPEKAEEIRTGALNTVHAGQIVIIESTAKGRQGIFADLCFQAIKNKKEGLDLSQLDYRLHFFPWYEDSEYSISTPTVIPREMNEYMNGVEKQTGVKISKEQRAWYYKKKQTQKDQMYSEYPSTPEEAFLATIEGSYYGKQMDLLRERGKIGTVPYDPTLLVDTWWDLGMGDSMSITFTQTYGMEVRVIDYYENSGEGLAHYNKVLREKPYAYGTHNAPFDIAVRELGTGKSRLETAREMGLNFTVTEKLAVEDGIEAVRNLLHFCYFNKSTTEKLVMALDEYRKEWDDNLGDWKNKPLHNWASHAADSFRTLAVGHRKVHPLGAEVVDPEIIEMQNEKENEKKQFNPFAM